MKRKRGYSRRLLFQLKKDEGKIYDVTLEEQLPVRNLKPAVVKVYDYYQTSEYRVQTGVTAGDPSPRQLTCV